MDNSISARISKELYTSSLLVMRARWYYSFLAFILTLIAIPKTEFPYLIVPITIIFGIALFANLVLAIYLEKNNYEKIGEIKLWYINISQVIFDLIYFFLFLVFSGSGLNSYIEIFFFLPIIISMMFFGFKGSIAVSIVSSIFLVFGIIANSGIINTLLNSPRNFWDVYASSNLSYSLSQAGVIVLIYILAGFFSSIITKALRSRELELQKKFLEEESSVRKLKELTRDFELSSRLLVRRDVELTISNERMQELDAMKTEIISVAAHQLRTPLSGIKWMIKMLLDGDVGAINTNQKEWLTRGYDSNERLIRVVNDLLEVDKLESGRIKYVFKQVDIKDIIEISIASVLPKASLKGMHITFSSSKNIPKLSLDPERMVDMFQNLIDNAVKYSKDNSNVSITAQLINDIVRVTISDTGIGITEKDKKRIFSRFFRGENAKQYDTEGSGLGLSIVNNIVSRHAGNISFTSEVGKGTTFSVDLPLQPLRTEHNPS